VVVAGVDWFSFLNGQDAMRLSLWMSLVKTFSTGWSIERHDSYVLTFAQKGWGHINLTGDYVWPEVPAKQGFFRPLQPFHA